MRTRIIILALLSISVFHSSYAQQETNYEAAPLRKTGCSNPKFVEAELKAYQELVSTREQIEKWRTDRITAIENEKKNTLDGANHRYQSTLQGCPGKPAGCSSDAKTRYDDDTRVALDSRDSSLVKMQKKAAKNYQDAQEEYDKAVSDAIKLYCHAFEATGQATYGGYSGAICDLAKNFTVKYSFASLGMEYDIKFVPSTGNARAGTFSFYTKWKTAILEGNGTYTIEGEAIDKPKILMTATTKGTIPQASVPGGGHSQIDLVPLRTNDCEGK